VIGSRLFASDKNPCRMMNQDRIFFVRQGIFQRKRKYEKDKFEREREISGGANRPPGRRDSVSAGFAGDKIGFSEIAPDHHGVSVYQGGAWQRPPR
jgi:hypothetical protein